MSGLRVRTLTINNDDVGVRGYHVEGGYDVGGVGGYDVGGVRGYGVGKVEGSAEQLFWYIYMSQPLSGLCMYS